MQAGTIRESLSTSFHGVEFAWHTTDPGKEIHAEKRHENAAKAEQKGSKETTIEGQGLRYEGWKTHFG
ncbi:MAG: hypothetical protein M1476_05705 [Candidatus Thermoplasmatota archaeon]|nr:hypothetical protein [Candidatus Thermoplasmatota archaeon]